MSNPNPPAPTPVSPRWFVWVAAISLLLYGIFLWTKSTASAGGSDSSGYLNSAKLLAEGRLQTPLRLPPELGQPTALKRDHFTPLGFLPARDPGSVAPTYPTGLPLHFAAASKVLGWHAGPRLVIILSALVAVWLTYLVALELGLPRLLATTAAIVLGAYPIFVFSFIQALSDGLATTWTLAATLWALRSRGRAFYAAAAGVAFSIAVLVRPTNVLFAPALLILLGFNLRRLALFAVSGIPAAIWFLLYNNHQYGGPLKSGYGDVASAFSTIYGAPTLVHFTKWLAAFHPSIILILPLFVLARPETRSRGALALAVAFTVVTGFYLFYDVSHDVWWCLRFILPVAPALVLLALLGVEALARGPAAKRPRLFRATAAAVLCGWAVAVSVFWSGKLHLFLIQRYEQAYEDASLAAKKVLAPNSLVAACAFSGAIYFYTDMAVIRSDMVEGPDFKRHAALARTAGRPVCAIVFDFEEEELRTRCPGNWKRVGGHANVGFWQLE